MTPSLDPISNWKTSVDSPPSFVTFSYAYRNLHLFNARVNVKDSIITWTDDGFVFNDDNLEREETEEFFFS